MKTAFKWTATLLALSLAAPVTAAEFNYSYLEMEADTSFTDNTAAAPTKNADGNFVGINASWQFAPAWYAKLIYSREDTQFANLVLTTDLELDTDQRFVGGGIGRIQALGENTALTIEALILYTKVTHDVPQVTPLAFGPPRVGIRESIIADTGYGATLALRQRVSERFELEAGFNFIDIALEQEYKARAAGRWHLAENFSLGLHASFSKHSDANFNNIVKFGLTVRVAL